jgi:hypothetical protein
VSDHSSGKRRPVNDVAKFQEPTADANDVDLMAVQHFVIKAKPLLNVRVSNYKQQES